MNHQRAPLARLPPPTAPPDGRQRLTQQGREAIAQRRFVVAHARVRREQEEREAARRAERDRLWSVRDRQRDFMIDLRRREAQSASLAVEARRIRERLAEIEQLQESLREEEQEAREEAGPIRYLPPVVEPPAQAMENLIFEIRNLEVDEPPAQAIENLIFEIQNLEVVEEAANIRFLPPVLEPPAQVREVFEYRFLNVDREHQMEVDEEMVEEPQAEAMEVDEEMVEEPQAEAMEVDDVEPALSTSTRLAPAEPSTPLPSADSTSQPSSSHVASISPAGSAQLAPQSPSASPPVSIVNQVEPVQVATSMTPQPLSASSIVASPLATVISPPRAVDVTPQHPAPVPPLVETVTPLRPVTVPTQSPSTSAPIRRSSLFSAPTSATPVSKSSSNSVTSTPGSSTSSRPVVSRVSPSLAPRQFTTPPSATPISASSVTPPQATVAALVDNSTTSEIESCRAAEDHTPVNSPSALAMRSATQSPAPDFNAATPDAETSSSRMSGPSSSQNVSVSPGTSRADSSQSMVEEISAPDAATPSSSTAPVVFAPNDVDSSPTLTPRAVRQVPEVVASPSSVSASNWAPHYNSPATATRRSSTGAAIQPLNSGLPPTARHAITSSTSMVNPRTPCSDVSTPRSSPSASSHIASSPSTVIHSPNPATSLANSSTTPGEAASLSEVVDESSSSSTSISPQPAVVTPRVTATPSSWSSPSTSAPRFVAVSPTRVASSGSLDLSTSADAQSLSSSPQVAASQSLRLVVSPATSPPMTPRVAQSPVAASMTVELTPDQQPQQTTTPSSQRSDSPSASPKSDPSPQRTASPTDSPLMTPRKLSGAAASSLNLPSTSSSGVVVASVSPVANSGNSGQSTSAAAQPFSASSQVAAPQSPRLVASPVAAPMPAQTSPVPQGSPRVVTPQSTPARGQQPQRMATPSPQRAASPPASPQPQGSPRVDVLQNVDVAPLTPRLVQATPPRAQLQRFATPSPQRAASPPASPPGNPPPPGTPSTPGSASPPGSPTPQGANSPPGTPSSGSSSSAASAPSSPSPPPTPPAGGPIRRPRRRRVVGPSDRWLRSQPRNRPEGWNPIPLDDAEIEVDDMQELLDEIDLALETLREYDYGQRGLDATQGLQRIRTTARRLNHMPYSRGQLYALERRFNVIRAILGLPN